MQALTRFSGVVMMSLIKFHDDIAHDAQCAQDVLQCCCRTDNANVRFDRVLLNTFLLNQYESTVYIASQRHVLNAAAINSSRLQNSSLDIQNMKIRYVHQDTQDSHAIWLRHCQHWEMET